MQKVARFIDFIGSRRFAVILLIITTSVILAGNLLPNPRLMPPGKAERFIAERPFLNRMSNMFHVMNITRSPFFLVIPAFIVLSITVCTARRFKSRAKAGISPPPPDRLELTYGGEAGASDIRCSLEKMGWRIVEKEFDGGAVYYGRKGDGGIWGSLTFHIGMVVVIIGGVVSMLSLFNGSIVLTEGFRSDGEGLYEGLKGAARDFPYRAMLLDSFEAVYREGGFPIDYKAIVKVFDRDGKEKEKVIGINRPIEEGAYTITLQRYSFTPRFIITEKDTGRVIEDAYVNLRVENIDETDQFYLQDIDVRVNARFFPDFYMVEGKELGTRSKEAKNPVFFLEFFKGGNKLGSGFLPLKKRMDFDEGRYTIEFADIRRWITFSVSKDAGLPFIKVGLLLVVTGLVARFVLNEKMLWIIRRNGRVEMGGRALYFPALFDPELKRIAGELGFDGKH